jgi:ankyrin repeat protein
MRRKDHKPFEDRPRWHVALWGPSLRREVASFGLESRRGVGNKVTDQDNDTKKHLNGGDSQWSKHSVKIRPVSQRRSNQASHKGPVHTSTPSTNVVSLRTEETQSIVIQPHLKEQLIRAETRHSQATYENLLFRLFYDAVYSGDMKALTLLIPRGIDPNRHLPNGQCLAHYIPYFELDSDIQELIKLGVDLNAESTLGLSPLEAHALLGNINEVVQLIKCGASPNHLSSSQRTPLLWAVLSRRIPMVDCLLQHAAEPNQKLLENTTALTWAILSDNPEALEMLLAAGAHTHTDTGLGILPLGLAVQQENVECVRALLNAGVTEGLDQACELATTLSNNDVLELLAPVVNTEKPGT